MQHYVGGKVVPTFEDVIASEDDGDNLHLLYQFTSHGIAESRETKINLRSTNHAFNQATTSLGLYDVLDDNQSASNIIVKKAFITTTFGWIK